MRTALALAAAITYACVIAAPAAAHSLPLTMAKALAQGVGQGFAAQDGRIVFDNARVTGCQRRTTHNVRCNLLIDGVDTESGTTLTCVAKVRVRYLHPRRTTLTVDTIGDPACEPR